MPYSQLLTVLAIDAVAIGLLAYAVYYRRHRRADLALAFVALNTGVFAAVTLLTVQQAGLALGFGLFGILSIVRLRSSAISQGEVGYYFVALTLGLVNGLGHGHLPTVLTLDVLLVGVLFALDRPAIGGRTVTQRIVLEVVHTDPTGLRADIERRLGGDVIVCDVVEIDYVREVTICEVRVRPRPRPRQHEPHRAVESIR
jgi:hypothetical protein